jgi:iron complex outermembrane receptor protein
MGEIMRVNRVLKMAVAYTLAAASSMALAQTPAPSAVTELETVIVTGSYIKGTVEDAALPVDVITSEDLQKQGSPTMVDLIKSIPAVQGTVGESNQFGSAASAGSSSINLRGLGSQRTLVLLNGRRLANAPTGIGVDVNLLPSAAIERVEVLKDGAAATYGSDAIAGVVNFITKSGFEGLSVGGSYTHVEDSDGDYDANVAWGWQGDRSNALVAVGYRHRSELRNVDRDWAIKPFASNTLGGWSSGSITYQTSSNPLNTTTRFQDPVCTGFGGSVTSASTCFFQFTPYDNLVEEQDDYQIYAEFNMDLFESVKLHTEALYAAHDVPEEAVSPSYSPTQGPTATQANYFIPYVTGNPSASNPGLTALLPNLSAAQQSAIAAAGGVYTTVGAWRPFSFAGNPVTGRDQHNSRKFDGFRLSAGLKGEITSNINWDTAVTYMENGSEISTPDALVSRLDLALRGLGGPNCVGNVPGANGCVWLNPFSTGIAYTGATGVPNPLNNYNAASAAGNAAAMDWLTVPNSFEATTKLLVVDAVLSGELDLIHLPGGNMGWAAGLQYRDNRFVREVSDFTNVDVNPCPVLGDTTCAVHTGALSFNGPLSSQDLDQQISAAFAEFSLPILDSLQAQLAVRYEDYGGEVGSTTNPKLSVRWKPLDWLTLRGSAGTTFRGPVQSTLAPGNTTALLNNYGTFKPFDTAGNPALKPETADTYNLGFIIKAGGFGASVDYWNYLFKDALVAENGLQVTQAFFGPATTAAPGGTFGATHCGDPAYAALQARLTFNAGTCADGTQLLRTQLYNINSTSETEITGIDASLYYTFNVGGGDFTLGADGTYNLHYNLGANYIAGILVDPAQDAIGTRGGRAGPEPQWKGAAYADYSIGKHNVRWTSRYVSEMLDLQQTALADGTPGKVVGSFLTHDLTYLVKVYGETTINLSVFNVLDEAPPFARLSLNYEPFIGNPVGRYVKVGVSTKF